MTAAVQENGLRTATAMSVPAFAVIVIIIIIPTVCSNGDALLHEDNAYHLDGYDYCRECYDEECGKSQYIHEYGYKPEPVFYGDSNRYFGVELEIDGAGKDDDYAEELLNIGNESGEHIYIKSDGSLNDGMEIVSHPMTLDYHKNFCWENIMKKANLPWLSFPPDLNVRTAYSCQP